MMLRYNSVPARPGFVFCFWISFDLVVRINLILYDLNTGRHLSIPENLMNGLAPILFPEGWLFLPHGVARRCYTFTAMTSQDDKYQVLKISKGLNQII